MNRKMSTNHSDRCVRPITVGCWLAIAVACGGSSKSSPGSGAAGTDSGTGTTTAGSGNASSGGSGGMVATGATGDVGSGGAASGTTGGSTGDAGMGATSTSSGGASSGAAGESSDTGGTDSGGADSGGTDSGGTGGFRGTTTGTGGTGGTGGGPTGVVEELGSECDTPAELACAGNHQRVSLICVGGMWEVNETCPENHACDTTPGFDQGTCKQRLPECIGQEPASGHGVCQDSTTLLQCGPDNVTLEPVECEGSCNAGACDNRPNHCPAEPFINCGRECGEVSAYCSNGGDCEVASAAFLSFEEPGQSHLVRVGDYDTLCDLNCTTSESHGFWLYAVTDATLRWRISLPAPLRMAVSGTCSDQSVGGCVVVGPDIGNYALLGLVMTDDPAASEQNILVESAAEGEVLECP